MSLENTETKPRLQELSGSDYEIADGQPDIRGWDVKDNSDKKIGEVKELLFDEQSRKVRYIILDLEGNVFDVESRDVLVPIGIAQLHEKDDDVILPGITASQLSSLPEYKKGNHTPDNESTVRNIFGGGSAVAGTALTGASLINHDDTFYNHEHFNEDNLYKKRTGATDESATIPVIKEELEVGKREVESGGVRLRTKIVENEVSKSIDLREEKVHIERTAVDKPVTEADFKDEVVEIIEMAEVPVVAKEARVVEEISLNKEVTEKEQIIKDTVRSTEVEIERTDKDDTLSSTKSDLI